MTHIHIACSARNAGRWIDALLESLVSQTHRDWELWIRDDGSTDDTWAKLEAWRAREPRIATTMRGESALGHVQAYADVLARLPLSAQIVATVDADDVWMPHRLERTLAALAEEERARPGPVLVYTDLLVVDEELRILSPSFWANEGIDPEPRGLRSLAIQNVAVSPTLLFNAALLAELREVPPAAIHQDWWFALVAAATGRLVAVHEPTVLYRQHGANVTGARVRSAWTRAAGAWSRRARVASDLDRVARQAEAFVTRFCSRIAPDERRALEGLASIVHLRGWRRRAAIARWRWFPPHGVLRNVGVCLRG
jgi:glycosyltransferase involved in cell wall biosynthesis